MQRSIRTGGHHLDRVVDPSKGTAEMGTKDGGQESQRLRKLKQVSLVTLTVQNALLGLSMRYARVRGGDMFFEGVAVLMAEVVKLVCCLVLVFYEEGQSLDRLLRSLKQNIIDNKLDTLMVCVPSLIYLVQNNLLYVAAEHLDVATYQITYQLKILTTAMFAVLILKQTLLKTQWASLVLLLAGVATVQLSDAKETSVSSEHQDRSIGLLAAVVSCFLSGLAGVYFEKILKGSNVSVWMRNIQLSSMSIPLGVGVAFVKHGPSIMSKGFFFGFDSYVVYLVCLNAMGGLIVAAVIKYADNILKGFACSLAIVLTCVLAVFMFGFEITLNFCLGAAAVIASIFLYGYRPPAPPPQTSDC